MESLTSQQKIAETLLSLSPQEAANVLKTLDEHELLSVGESILKNTRRFYTTKKDSRSSKLTLSDKLPEFPPQHTDTDSTDNTENTQESTFLKLTAKDFSELEVVKALYRIAFGSKRSQELIRKLLQINLQQRLSFLNNYSTDQLFIVISKESIQVISLVISVLKPHLAAQLLYLFDSSIKNDIIVRIVNQKTPSEKILRIMEETLKRNLSALAIQDKKKTAPNGENNLVRILEQLNYQTQENILSTLKDNALKERILYRLFSWLDLEALNQREIEQILEQYSNKDLAKLLLIDGVVARNTLQTIISKNKMLLITDELDAINKKFQTQAEAATEAKQIKKQLFKKVRQLLHHQKIDINEK